MVPYVTGEADDVLAKGGSERYQDIAGRSLLETSHNNNLWYNSGKIQDKRVQVLGQLLTLADMGVDPKKVNDIRQMDEP